MIALIVGKREEGKTTLGLFLAMQWSPFVIILDTRRQFEIGIPVHSLSELDDAIDEGSPVIVYQPESEEDEEESGELARNIMARGMEHNPAGRFTFLIDEAGEVAKFGRAVRPLRKMIKFVRLDTVNVLLLCHRPTDLDPVFRSLMTDFYLFRVNGDRDIEWLDGIDSITDEAIQVVQKLPRHHFIRLKPGVEGYQLFNDPSAWYVQYDQGVTVNG
jgi:hypothetical protein